MAVFLLQYDLVNESGSHDYEPLWAELKRIGSHRTQYSSWLVLFKDGATAKGVHDYFKPYVDKDDRLMVCSFQKGAHWFSNAMGGTNAWLAKHQP
jgi:hypothetical protein